MKTLGKLFAMFLIASGVAHGAPNEVDRQLLEAGQRNLLKNGGFENGLQQWTNSGGLTFTIETTSAGFGTRSADWDADTIGDTLTTEAKAVEPGLRGRNCLAEIHYLWAGTDDQLSLQAFDGTNILATTFIKATAAAVWSRVAVGFECPTSGNISLRIIAENASAVEIRVDQAWLGSDKREVQITQASHVATWEYATLSACNAWTRTNAALGAFTADTGCVGPTVLLNSGIGSPQTTDDDLPQVTINNLPIGHYYMVISGATATLSDGVRATFGVSDGTTVGGQSQVDAQTAADQESVRVSGSFEYSASGNRTFALHTASVSGSVTLDTDTNLGKLQFHLYRYPTASETALLINNEPKTRYLKARHTTVGNCEWIFTGTSFGDTTTEDSDCNFTVDTNINMGTSPTSRQCTADDCPGILWTPPEGGTFRVCARIKGTHGSAGVASIYRLQEINASVTLDSNSIETDQANDGNEIALCGALVVGSVTEQDLRVQASTSAGNALIHGDGQASGAGTAITWEIWPISVPGPELVVAKQVATETTGGVNHCTYLVTAQALTRSDGDCVASLADTGNGVATATFKTGLFSSAPNCTTSVIATTAGDQCGLNALPTSTTAATLCEIANNTATDLTHMVTCTGPK